jgi:uncharacterized protein YggE
MTQNANRVSAIRATIEGLGVAAQDIHEANAGLLYNPNNGSYQTGTILTVELDGTTVSKAGATVDAALKAGAARCASVSFGLSDDADANAQVLREALANARRQADAVATAGGVKIIGVQAITQSTNSYGGPAAAKYGPAFGGPGPQPLSCPAAGRGGYYGSPNPQIAVTATVTVTYLIG